MLQLGFGRIVTKILDALSTNVEMSTLVGRAMPSFFTRSEELCASSRVERRHLWAADDSVRILGKVRVRIRSPERISVMPDEMEKRVENFRAIQKSSRFSKKNQRRMYDCKAWPCSFSGC